MILFVLWTLLLAPLVVAAVSQDSCYADETDPYTMFATATPYKTWLEESVDPVLAAEQCEPVQFWIISRHGTRYADADEVDDLKDLYDLQKKIIKNHEEKGKGSLCAKDLENLKLWTLQVVSNLKSDLTPQGYNDLYYLAERFKRRFRTLFNQTVTKDSFKVRFTTKQRTAASAFAFVDGLFGTGMGLEFPEPLEDDMLIKPYASCEKWEDDVDDNKDTTKEKKAFEDGSLVTTLLGTVSGRLGFDETLDLDDIDLMYSACRYDKAWHLDKVSPWCAAFSEDDLKVLEYREDLDLYYRTGYGNDLNKKVGCPPVKDFLDRFSDIEKGKSQPAGVFYFTHHEMILLVLTSLGFEKDQQPLTHSNYDQMQNRLWRSSVISPFAANLAAVFFQCATGEQYRIQIYLNELPVNIDGCSKGLCDWSYFKTQFGSISSSCNLDFC